MNREFSYFIARIKNNNAIPEEKKSSLCDYLCSNLFSNVSVFSRENFNKIETILKDFDYDWYVFSIMLAIAGKINDQNSNNVKLEKGVPSAEYVYTIYNIFKALDMEVMTYDYGHSAANLAIGKIAYKMIFHKGLMCDGTNILDLAKKIYDTYCSTYNVNKSVYTIFKILCRADRGLLILGGNYSHVFDNEDFLSLFEYFREMNNIYIMDLIKDFYPVFGNELFSLIKKSFVNASAEKITKDYVEKYLEMVKTKRETFVYQKEEVVKKIEKIDLQSENDIKSVFNQMLENFKNNKDISDNVKENIISNISTIFNEKYKIQEDFISEEFNSFYNNCSAYIEELSSKSYSNVDIDGLISELVGNCKDFFIEYDLKKFREIVDYVVENTNITADELRSVGAKCANIFKDADISKLKVINNALEEFKMFVNSTNDSFNITDNMFKTILLNNPELLLKNNNLEEVLSFLKGDFSLDKYGYRYPGFAVPKDFLSSNFYKKMKEDNYKMLLECNLPRVIHNLNYINDKCDNYGINFNKLNINDDLLYLIMNNDLYTEGTNMLDTIKEIFTEKDFKNILEMNPELFLLSARDAEIIVERSIFNINTDYSFYDLFSSELYNYNKNKYVSNDDDTLVNADFNYVNLNLDNYPLFDVEEILASNLIANGHPDSLFKVYKDREKQENELRSLIVKLENCDVSDIPDMLSIVNNISKLYTALYYQVPNVSCKNEIIDIINFKKQKCLYDADDISEEIDAEKQSISTYLEDKKDSDFAISHLKEIIGSVHSEAVKRDLQNFLTKFKEDRIVKADNKYDKTSTALENMEIQLQILERQVEHLKYVVTIVDSVDDSLKFNNQQIHCKPSFTINDLSNMSLQDEVENIEDVLGGHNIVLFADGVDLSDIPNDRNFIDKVNKFLGDTERSILSQNFMKNPTPNSVEAYQDHRSGIMSRREERTPVRVYYIPVKNKYFNCYYVIAVNYKDHGHYDGGCSNDDVYNRRMKEVSKLEKKINNMEYDEVIAFIKQSQEKYEQKMLPITNKIKSNNKK